MANKQKKEINKKSIVLIAVLILIAGSIYHLNAQKDSVSQSGDKGEAAESDSNLDKQTTAKPEGYIKDKKAVKQKEKLYQMAPELTGISGYINTNNTLTIGSLKGKVVLVDFWTYTCINCIRTLPYLKAWHEKYNDDGLAIIGVHTPEFEFEKKYENVLDAVGKYEIKYSVVQDNDYSTWRAYSNRYWPHKYLVDIDGFIRYDHIGEGRYEETEKMIQELLEERMQRTGNNIINEDIAEPNVTVDVDFGKVGTPEIYLGYGFARGNFGNKEGLQAEQIIDYKLPEIIKPNNIYLEGRWKISKDNSELVGDEGRIFLGYDAKVVNIVSSSEQGSEIEVFLDSQSLNEPKSGIDIKITSGKSIAAINEGRLYNLIDNEYGTGLLELKIDGKGFKIYAFTFG